jgi:hypothetical protein
VATNHDHFAEVSTELGAIKVRLDHVEENQGDIKANWKYVQKELQEQRAWRNQLKGGMKLIWILFGVAGSAGAFVSWVLQHMKWS